MRSALVVPVAVMTFAVACSDSATAPIPVPLADGPSLAITFKQSGPTVNFVSVASANLRATFDISGLGNLPAGQGVLVEATAFAEALYACENGGGNFPSDPKKQDVAREVKTEGNFPVRNGRAQGTLILAVPASTLNCPGTQTPRLVSVVWSDVEVTVVSPPGPTADSSSPGIDETYEKTFFVLN
jgi:hypothetical protein